MLHLLPAAMPSGWQPGPVLAPDGAGARLDAPLAWALLVGGALLYGGVMLLLLLAVSRPARPVRPARWLIGGGLLLPLVVLSTLHWVNLRHLRTLAAAPPAGLPLIAVSAREWWWQLRLVDADSGAEALLANELVLPVGQPVRLGLSSERLIHSLWIPALAGKIDLIPGRVQHLVLQADRAGAWRGPCAEFCGEAHARMVLRVVAVPAAEWAVWWQHQLQPALPPTDAQQRQGLLHFIARRCNACHAVRGLAGEGATAGPDLTHLASRGHLGAGTLPNSAAGLRAWLTDVQMHKPGAQMPTQTMDAAALDALVAFLGGLR